MPVPNKRSTTLRRNDSYDVNSNLSTERKATKCSNRPQSRRRRRIAPKIFGGRFRVVVTRGLLLSAILWIIFLFCSDRISMIGTKIKERAGGSNGGGVHVATNNGYESPLLIITCQRPDYLEKTLEHVLATIPQPCGFGCPVVVSEDGNHESNEKLLLSFKEKFEAKGIDLIHIIHHQEQNSLRGGTSPYVLLAKHFGWALTQLFDGVAYSLQRKEQQTQHPLPQRVILLEEDIEVAPDFFSYMESTSVVLDHDPTLFAVSAFNDNGHLENGDPTRLLRSDFFPGLGWMMTRNLWKNELQAKWPDGYWDDWLREPVQRKARQVIRPEVSRTYHFGSKGGASSNQFGSVLQRVKLNEQAIRWDSEDISYLNDSTFENQYTELVMNSRLANTIEEAKEIAAVENARMEYERFSDFQYLAERLGIMTDEKASVPRTAYKGIIEVRLGSGLLFLTPKGGFQGYRK